MFCGLYEKSKMSYKTSLRIRKVHRYLGLAIGLQFIMWTVSGLYFSWTDLDEIHGDPYLNNGYQKPQFESLYPTDSLSIKIQSLELVAVGSVPYYWINNSQLVNASDGSIKKEITQAQALEVAQAHVKQGYKVLHVSRITSTDAHHEYRGRSLPAYAIQYDHPEQLTAYVAAENGKFQRVRHRSWRWFDFLWMSHTMDYQGRDDFNNILLRIFSVFGLMTVLSGFLLWIVSSPSLRKPGKS